MEASRAGTVVRRGAQAMLQAGPAKGVLGSVEESIPLQQRILADPDFAAGRFDTHFIEKLLGTNGK